MARKGLNPKLRARVDQVWAIVHANPTSFVTQVREVEALQADLAPDERLQLTSWVYEALFTPPWMRLDGK